MRWTLEVVIGELRPWPESVKVVRGNSGEAMRYDRSERSNDGVAETCVPDDYTAKLMAELVQVMEERDTLSSKFEVSQGMRHDEHERHTKENASLRERITTQKQTIQVYRDESREWREVAEHAQAENAKLRELVRDMWPHVRHRSRMCRECELPCRETGDGCLLYEPMRQRMRGLGVEVDA